MDATRQCPICDAAVEPQAAQCPRGHVLKFEPAGPDVANETATIIHVEPVWKRLWPKKRDDAPKKQNDVGESSSSSRSASASGGEASPVDGQPDAEGSRGLRSASGAESDEDKEPPAVSTVRERPGAKRDAADAAAESEAPVRTPPDGRKVSPSRQLRVRDSIAECFHCDRLIDAQRHNEIYVRPSYCPWCGNSVRSLIGRRLEGFRLDRVLAAGGFGIVYLASNVTEPRIKAVFKVLRPWIGYTKPKMVKIFVDEARLAELIGQSSWNVVRVTGVREKPWPYFVMEYIRGQTLDSYLAMKAPERIPLFECIGFLRGMARALQATHSKEYVHRDLKPMNLMVLESGEAESHEERIKLLDFGLAMRFAGRPPELSVLEVDSINDAQEESAPVDPSSLLGKAGTPEYMAPEAFDGKHRYEGDIYSFGVAAYETLTGEKPWPPCPPGMDRLTYWMGCHKSRAPRPIRELRPEVPKWLARTVMDCLEADPEDRIPDCRELLQRLKAPVPKWVYGAIAAGVIFVLSLMVWAFYNSQEVGRVDRWTYAGTEHDEGNLWVREGEDLVEWKDLRFHLADDAPLRADELDWRVRLQSSGELLESVRCEAVPGGGGSDEKGAVQVRFINSAELDRIPGHELVVEGRGRRFLRQVEVDVSLTVHESSPPRIDERLEYVGIDGSPREWSDPETRFNGSARLVAAIDGPTIDADSVELRVENRVEPIRGEPLSAGASFENRWRFSLAELPSSRHSAVIVAKDRARYSSRPVPSPPFTFYVDKEVECRVEDPLLAGGQAYYQLTPGEPLSALVLRTDDGGESVPWELFESPSSVSVFGLLQSFRGEATPPTVALSDVVADRSYLLRVPVPEGAVVLALRWELADRAVPKANVLEAALPILDVPAHLEDRDVPRAHITAGSLRRQPVHLATGQEGERLEPLRIAFSDRDLVRGLVEVEVRPGRVVEAELHCEIAAARSSPGASPKEPIKMPGVIDEAVIRFERVELLPNVEQQFSVRLRDALGRDFHRRFALWLDSRRPDLLVTQRSEGPGSYAFVDGRDEAAAYRYHATDSGGDVTLQIASSERLESAWVSIGNRSLEIPLTLESEDGAAPHSIVYASYRLNEFVELEEGEFPYTLTVDDLGGQTSRIAGRIRLNARGPRIELVDDKKIVFGSDESYRFAVSDPNGLSGEVSDIEVVAHMEEDGRELHLPVQALSNAEPRTERLRFALDTETLPDDSTGTLVFKMRDADGMASEQRRSFSVARNFRWARSASWGGLDWVLCTPQGAQQFYVSKTEVPNRVYGDEKFIGAEGYSVRMPGTSERWPRYWKEQVEGFPAYRRGEEQLSGAEFPVVGLTPEEAEAFLRTVFHPSVRLPTYTEWRVAARQVYSGDVPTDEDKAYILYNGVAVSDDPEAGGPMVLEKAEMMTPRGGLVWHLPVAWNPYPEDDVRHRSVLHIVGNVAEHVRLPSLEASGKEAVYGRAGDASNTQGEVLTLTRPAPYAFRGRSRSFDTGFRALIDLSGDIDEGFREAARVR